MKTQTRRALFWATVALGGVLPWLTILVSALAFDTPLGDAFHPLTDVLPFFPVTVLLIAAWWAMPFVVFALLCDRLAIAEWEPLRRNPLLILLGIPVAVSQMGALESFYAGIYLLLFLVFAIVAVPSWGLRSPIARTVLALFALMALFLFSLITYGFFMAMGTAQLGQHIAAPLGILFYMTMALFIGYLFAKPIDLLVCRGESQPEPTERPKPSAWLIGGNALACGLGFIGVMLAYSKFAGSVVARHEIGEILAAHPLMLALAAVSSGVMLGLVIYLVAFAMLRSGKYRREAAVLIVCLAVLPGLLTGTAPGILGERVIANVLESEYLGTYLLIDGFDPIDRIAVSPDGTRIAAENPGRLVVWDVASGDAIIDARDETWRVWSSGLALAWSPDSSLVSVAAHGNRIAIVDGYSGRRLHSLALPKSERPDPSVIDTVFSRNGRRLITAAGEDLIHVYELTSEKVEQTWQSPVPTHSLTAIALSPDEHRLAVAGLSSPDSSRTGGFVAMLDPATGEILYVVDDFEQVASQVSFSPDGSQLLLTGADNPPQLIDAFTGRRLLELRHHCPASSAPHAASVFYATFLDSHSVAVACRDGVAEICDASRGDCRMLFELRLFGLHGIAAHPNGRHVAFLEQNRTIAIWDSQTKKPLRTFHLP
jgi:hypothetical protein